MTNILKFTKEKSLKNQLFLIRVFIFLWKIYMCYDIIR